MTIFSHGPTRILSQVEQISVSILCCQACTASLRLSVTQKNNIEEGLWKEAVNLPVARPGSEWGFISGVLSKEAHSLI